GDNKVLVTGAKGRSPTKYLKVSGIYLDGFKMTGQLVIGGIDAWKKAAAVAHAILMKTRVLFEKHNLGKYRDVNVEVLGAEHTYGGHAKTRNTREVVLNITVHHDKLEAVKIFGMELAPSATSMAPGIAGNFFVSLYNELSSTWSGLGRPHPSPCLVHFARLISKDSVSSFVIVGNKSEEKVTFDGPTHNDNIIPPPFPLSEILNEMDYEIDSEIMIKVPLIKLAWGRSGDKGDVCNIGGGGLSSLNIDKQGKTYAQMLLSFEIDVPS
ncbi:16879_t:CDS:2, partial [Cetraspora pellucida]